MNRSRQYILLIIIPFLLIGCDLVRLDLSKFKKLDNLTPTIVLPISSGDYLISDYISIPETGNTLISTPQLTLNPIVYDLTGLDYNIDAVDSFFVVLKTTNACPMQLQYSLTFNGITLNSTVLSGGTLDALGHVTTPSERTTEFLLTNDEYRKFNQATSLTLSVILSQPKTGPVIANDLKSGKISVRISFRASLNILKL
jgi:hypothetical protein